MQATTTVLPQYAYGAPSHSLAGSEPYGDAYAHAPMAKRRRLDDGASQSPADDASYASWDEPHQHQHQHQHQHSTAHQQFPSPYNGTGYAGGTHVTSAHHQPEVNDRVGAQHAALSSQWNSTASLYPDVSSYQQPYFYQQTDPSVYMSPWPPAQGNGADYHTLNDNNYTGIQTPGLPFFSTQTPAGQPQTLDSDSRYQSYPEFVAGTYDYTVAQPQRAASSYYSEDASMHLKLQSLSILDNLATQLIHTIAKASFSQIQELMQGTDDEDCQAYSTLKNLFDKTRKVYSRETPFIDAIAIQMFQPNQQEVIRKANIATFISSILGAHDVSFFHLNEFFLETFVPLGHRLLKWQGAIYFELKTQTYISALMNSDSSPEAMLEELFPSDLDAQILTRHPDTPTLSPSEQDFVDRSRARKSYLLAEPSTEEALRELPKKYQWNDFVREFAACINKNVDSIMNIPLRAQPAFSSANTEKRTANTAQSVQDAMAAQQGIIARNAQTASALNGISAMPSLPQRASSGEKKSGGSGTTVRQPWTDAEQDALLAGLEKVNGPHWSQILALYGRGGSESEVLKDRNQVQLKDKARNLKLWYLKMGKQVPLALRGVTGELRKRGGARARAALGLLDEDQEGGAAADAASDELAGGESTVSSVDSKSSARRKKGRK